MAHFNIAEAIAAQGKYCSENKFPYFAPSDGICFSCGNNIYEEIDHGGHKTGISVEGAGSRLITGCPHCNRTYCD